MKYYLGLDVGGTNLTAGIVDEDFNIIAKESIPAEAGRPIKRITDDMINVTKTVIKAAGKEDYEFGSWGIGMPSLVNPRTNLLVHANCFGWRNVPIYSYLENRLPYPVYIENDANCAALGEVMIGSARGLSNVLVVTLGTGVGSGIISNGRIFMGGDGLGAAFGHTKLVYKGKMCSCGQMGCVDTYCSATGLIDMAKETILKYKDSVLYELCGNDFTALDARHIFEALEIGDEAATRIFNEYVDLLAAALGNYTALFRPEAIIVGGGVAGAGEVLIKPLRERLALNTFAADEIGIPEIRIAEKGNDAGIIGAAFLAEYKNNKGRESKNEKE